MARQMLAGHILLLVQKSPAAARKATVPSPLLHKDGPVWKTEPLDAYLLFNYDGEDLKLVKF